MIHQHERWHLTRWPAALSAEQESDHVVAVVHRAHVRPGGRPFAAIELEHVAAACPLDEVDGIGKIGELPRTRRAKTKIPQHRLAISAIVLQSIAQCAAADDVEAIPAQFILNFAERRGLDQDCAIVSSLAYPIQLTAPVLGEAEHTTHHIVRFGIRGVDTHLVSGRLESQIHVAEVDGVPDAEKSHGVEAWGAGSPCSMTRSCSSSQRSSTEQWRVKREAGGGTREAARGRREARGGRRGCSAK